jgi:hypothetical protein
MQKLMLSVMAAAMLVAFSAPSFADEGKKEQEKGKKGKLVQMVYGEEGKKETKKPGPGK